MTPGMGDAWARGDYPQIDAVSKALFGITPDEAEAVERPADWDNVETKPANQQVFAFEDEGWDVTDSRRRPLRMLVHLGPPLWLAIRGVAGEVPLGGETTQEDNWEAKLAAEARLFKKR